MRSTQQPDFVPPMTVEAAHDFARGLLNLERRTPHDTDAALVRIEQRYGLSGNQIEHLAYGRAKTIDVGLFARLRAAYLDLCERQVGKLQHQIAVLKATGSDDDISDLEREAESLAARIAEKKARLGGGK